MLKRAATAAGLVAICALPAFAHEAVSGWMYPFECCGGQDCAELSKDRVRIAPGGYMIDGHFFISQNDARSSPDGRYHGCFPKPDKLRCFFAPVMGF